MEHILPYLLVLACPVSMGAMMWFMMRDKHEPDGEIGELKRRIAELEEVAAAPGDGHESKEPVGTHGSPRPDSP